jgi:predicted  nucleic acid-binding Zn-ribbon protein
MELISKYPEFEPMYSHLYDMCRNIEGVMNMFSKELQIMDHNTATYMIDELQEELDTTKEQLDTTKEQLDIANSMNLKKDDTISSQAEEIIRLKQLLADKGVEA